MLIAQLSDPHVRPEGVLYRAAVDSNAMFAAAVARVNALDAPPDLVLLTGDLVEEGEPAAYAMLRRLLGPLRVPVLAIPGNRDGRDAFRKAFHDHGYMPPSGPINYVVDDLGPVRVVALDVTVPGQSRGAVSTNGAKWLDDELAAEPGRPTLLMMHQPPFDTGVPCPDLHCCRDGGRLAEVVARHSSVERIVCGHAHRFMELRFAGTMLCTAPSTTIVTDRRPDGGEGTLSCVEPPGLLLHHWRPEAGLITRLVPIGDFPGTHTFG